MTALRARCLCRSKAIRIKAPKNATLIVVSSGFIVSILVLPVFRLVSSDDGLLSAPIYNNRCNGGPDGGESGRDGGGDGDGLGRGVLQGVRDDCGDGVN